MKMVHGSRAFLPQHEPIPVPKLNNHTPEFISPTQLDIELHQLNKRNT